MTTPTREQVVQWAKEAATKTVDWDLTSKPITDADVLIMGAFGDLIARIVSVARAGLEATIAEQAAEIEWVKNALTTYYHFTGMPLGHSVTELVRGYQDANQSRETFQRELNAAEKVIAEQAKQLEEMAEAIKKAADQIRVCDYTPARSTLLVAIAVMSHKESRE